MRHDTSPPDHAQKTSRRRLGRAATLLVGAPLALALSACMQSSSPSGDVRMGAAEGDAIEVVAVDNAFEPEVLEAEAGEEVTLEIRNDGGTRHNFVIGELGLDSGLLQSGDVVTATFTAPDGPVRFVCTLHRGMTGEIRTS